jgi:hypothetical protein
MTRVGGVRKVSLWRCELQKQTFEPVQNAAAAGHQASPSPTPPRVIVDQQKADVVMSGKVTGGGIECEFRHWRVG